MTLVQGHKYIIHAVQPCRQLGEKLDGKLRHISEGESERAEESDMNRNTWIYPRPVLHKSPVLDPDRAATWQTALLLRQRGRTTGGNIFRKIDVQASSVTDFQRICDKKDWGSFFLMLSCIFYLFFHFHISSLFSTAVVLNVPYERNFDVFRHILNVFLLRWSLVLVPLVSHLSVFQRRLFWIFSVFHVFGAGPLDVSEE